MTRESKGIWVVAEQVQRVISEVSFELVGCARNLADHAGGTEVTAVLLGSEIEVVADELVAFGADRVIVVDDPRLMFYQNDTYATVLEELVRQELPDMVLLGATAAGGELSATVAAKLGTGLAAHCVDLYMGPEGELVQVVPAFGGRVLGEILCSRQRPQMASVKPGVFLKPARDLSRQGEVVLRPATVLDGKTFALKTLRVVQEKPSGLPLEKAEVVVAGGWGVGSAEMWDLLEDLAQEIGAAVGCTRPALDEGWTQGEHTMIGTSGKTVRPRLYIGFGVSGVAHHVVGMKDSGVVISVNNDTKAPIFQVSDYGVVADVKKVLPLLLEAIRKQKAAQV